MLAHEGTPRKRTVRTIHELTGISLSTIRKLLNCDYLYGKGDEAWDSLTRAAQKQENEEKAGEEKTYETEVANAAERAEPRITARKNLHEIKRGLELLEKFVRAYEKSR
jgi:hypothetical protein